LSQKQAFSKIKNKKRSSPDLECFLVPKLAQDTGLGGGPISRVAAAPLLPAPMINLQEKLEVEAKNILLLPHP